ncbi:MAG: hypothetical protein ACRED6_00295 [Stellaceae bacterium]
MRLAVSIYEAVAWVAFGFLTFFDHYSYNAWNWVVALPVNVFLSQIWPIYLGILRWLPSP